MYQRNLKSLLFLVLMPLLLFAFGCEVKQSTLPETPIETTEEEKDKMDPQLKQNAELLMESLPTLNYDLALATRAAKSLRTSDIGLLVSVKKVDDAEIPNTTISRSVAALADIVDSSGQSFRVGFNDEGLPYTIDFPDGTDAGTVIVYDQAIS